MPIEFSEGYKEAARLRREQIEREMSPEGVAVARGLYPHVRKSKPAPDVGARGSIERALDLVLQGLQERMYAAVGGKDTSLGDPDEERSLTLKNRDLADLFCLVAERRASLHR